MSSLNNGLGHWVGNWNRDLSSFNAAKRGIDANCLETEEIIADVLGVEGFRQTIAGNILVGVEATALLQQRWLGVAFLPKTLVFYSNTCCVISLMPVTKLDSAHS